MRHIPFLLLHHFTPVPYCVPSTMYPPPPRLLRVSATAREYEKAHGRDRSDLQGFFDSSLPYLRHPEVRRWGDTLALARESDRDGASDVDGRGRGGGARA